MVGSGSGRRALRGGRPGRRPLARLDRRRPAATAARAARTSASRRKFTGYDIDGGYAERAVADERFCFPIPESYPDEHAAPLLCAGLIGYRALRLAGEGERLGLYGFGSSAHIICQVAVAPGPARLRLHPGGRHRDAGVRPRAGRRVGRARSGDPAASDLDAAIVFAPVGELMAEALRAHGARRDRSSARGST